MTDDRPRNNNGRFVPLACPMPNCAGTLRRESGVWRCDGLAEPERLDQELYACQFTFVSRENYESTLFAYLRAA